LRSNQQKRTTYDEVNEKRRQDGWLLYEFYESQRNRDDGNKA